MSLLLLYTDISHIEFDAPYQRLGSVLLLSEKCPDVGHTLQPVSQSLSVCECRWLSLNLIVSACDTVSTVITECCTIPPPGDSGSRTTSGGAVEGEHRRVSGWVCVQLEGDVTWD